MDCECTRFLFRGNRIQGLGHARQELYLDCLRSFKGVLRGFGKRLLWDMTPLPHTCLLAGLARTCKPQTRKGRSWTLAVADVAGKKKKKHQLPFHLLLDKANHADLLHSVGAYKTEFTIEKEFWLRGEPGR